MEFKELKARALELKAENDKLKLKVNSKKHEYAKIIQKNFVDIILPYMTEMNAFIKGIRLTGFEKEESLIKDNNFLVELALSSSGIHIAYKEWKSSGIHIACKEWKSYGLDCYIDFEDSCKKLQDYNWIFLADFFASIDSCETFMRKLNESYAVILSEAIERFETENPLLAETLRDLTEKISNASCMEEKENGTVEIHLGGKTYTAVLKEE